MSLTGILALFGKRKKSVKVYTRVGVFAHVVLFGDDMEQIRIRTTMSSY